MSSPIVRFDHVDKRYNQYHQITGGLKQFIFNLPKAIRMLRSSKYEALSDISFEVNPGETLGIIGRNGAGKSTILGLIAGVLKPSGGRVEVRGHVSPLLELGAGFHPELSGRENIFLKGVLIGLTRAEIARKVDEIIQFSELGDFITQPLRTYSSGMMARLGFAVVASLDPELLLIDEVLAVGDEKFQAKCLARMLEFKRRGVTMIFVSHSMKDVKQICDRVIWVQDHHVQAIGRAPVIVKRYLAS